jgi:hypothetical protein
MKSIPRSAHLLSMIALACAAVASLVTLAWSGSFPQPSPPLPSNNILAEARGWSAATLALALPLAILSIRAARRGSLSGRLAWLGVLAYLVYTYLELAVSGPFTPLYLVYIAAFACALVALVIAAGTLDVAALPQMIGARAPRRTVAIYSLLVAVFLAIAWLKSILARTAKGEFGWNDAIASVAHVVQALDLGLIVPLALLTAVLLLRKKPSGDLCASLMLIIGTCMGAALAGMVAWSAIDAGRSAIESAPFVVLFLISMILARWFFLSASRASHSHPGHGRPSSSFLKLP